MIAAVSPVPRSVGKKGADRPQLCAERKAFLGGYANSLLKKRTSVGNVWVAADVCAEGHDSVILLRVGAVETDHIIHQAESKEGRKLRTKRVSRADSL